MIILNFFLDDKECKEWKSWSQVMQIDDSNAYMFDYLAYIVVAVCIISHNSITVSDT